MKETKYIWKNGVFIPWKKAVTHVLTHALNYGTGIFEGLRCYPSAKGGLIFRLNDHVKRFFHSGKLLGMNFNFSQRQFAQAIKRTVVKNNVFDVYIRPLGFYGYQKIGPNPADSPVEIIIACIPLKDYLKSDFIKVKLASIRRIPPSSAFTNSKMTGMYYNSALASMEAWKSGFDEAIVLDENGYVAEGAAENIFMVKKGIVFTPPADNVLGGITRGTLFELFKDLGIKCVQKRITIKELSSADEAFFTGTAVEVHFIGWIGAKKIKKDNPVTRKIAQYYGKVMRGKIPKYKRWVTRV